jgi:hypothetical protein
MDDDIELTDDEHLRALTALEAVVGNHDAALPVLAGGDGERPLPELLAAYGRHTLDRILLAAFEINADTGSSEMRGAWRTSAPTRRPASSSCSPTPCATWPPAPAPTSTAKYIGISILGAVHAFTDADDSDALTLLRALRNQVLRCT